MVAMLMGDKKSVNIAGQQARFGQAVCKLLDAEPTINQQPNRFWARGFNNCRVARAAATQTFKAQSSALFQIVGNDLNDALGVG